MTLVLIIDDFPEVQQVLGAMLGSMGVESITASDGENSLSCSSPPFIRTW